MAPLQKRALVSLIIGLTLTVVVVILFVTMGGVNAFANDDRTRHVLTALMVAMVLLTGLLGVPWMTRKGAGADVDERDFAIVRRAPQVQLVAMMLTLAGWAIGLTEYYWDSGAIPIIWPYLMMWSVLIASTLAQSLGVLIGYWRSAA